MIWVKKDLFGCFRIEEIRDKDNETGLKEGGGIEMSTTVLHSRAALSLKYLLIDFFIKFSIDTYNDFESKLYTWYFCTCRNFIPPTTIKNKEKIKQNNVLSVEI